MNKKLVVIPLVLLVLMATAVSAGLFDSITGYASFNWASIKRVLTGRTGEAVPDSGTGGTGRPGGVIPDSGTGNTGRNEATVASATSSLNGCAYVMTSDIDFDTPQDACNSVSSSLAPVFIAREYLYLYYPNGQCNENNIKSVDTTTKLLTKGDVPELETDVTIECQPALQEQAPGHYRDESYKDTGVLCCTGAASTCGNGIKEEYEQLNEECDGTDFGEKTCENLGIGASGGTLSCSDWCMIETNQCTICGDGTKQGTEACDGSDLGGACCGGDGEAVIVIPDSGTGCTGRGTLTCNTDCTFDASGCGIIPNSGTGNTGR